MFLALNNENSADHWQESKERAECLRQYRGRLHPGLAAELAELERAGY